METRGLYGQVCLSCNADVLQNQHTSLRLCLMPLPDAIIVKDNEPGYGEQEE